MKGILSFIVFVLIVEEAITTRVFQSAKNYENEVDYENVIPSLTIDFPWKEYCYNQPIGKKIPHPEVCDKYIVCIGFGQVKNCPPRTHFNSFLEVCDWPEQAGCDPNYPTRSTSQPTSGPTNNPNPTSSPNLPTDSPWREACKQQPIGKKVPYPGNCEKYIVCIGHGQAMNCPPRTHFNSFLEVCDWPEQAGCDPNYPTRSTSQPTSGPTKPTNNPNPTSSPNLPTDSPWREACKQQPIGKKVPYPGNCDKYIVCIGHGQVMNCPPRTNFNAFLEVCDWPEQAGCDPNYPTRSTSHPTSGPTKPTTNPNPTSSPNLPTDSPWREACKQQPIGKKVPYPGNCDKYIVCIGHGQVMNCPPRTNFNAFLEVCDWPEQAGCDPNYPTRSTSQPTSGPTKPTNNPNPTSSPNLPTDSPWREACKQQPIGKKVPYPGNCEKYIVCIGHGQAMNCPPRTHFNSFLEVCDWPEQAGCDPNYPTRSTSGPTKSTNKPNPTSSQSLPTDSPWREACSQKSIGTKVPYPGSGNCDKYIVCIGHGKVKSCPPRTHFNEFLEVCDWPEQAGCDPNYLSRPKTSPKKKFFVDTDLYEPINHAVW